MFAMSLMATHLSCSKVIRRVGTLRLGTAASIVRCHLEVTAGRCTLALTWAKLGQPDLYDLLHDYLLVVCGSKVRARLPIRALSGPVQTHIRSPLGAAAPLSRIRRLGSGRRNHSKGRRLRPCARSVRLPGSAGTDQAPSDGERGFARDQAGFMAAPSITTPAVAYCHRATSNLRAMATISGLRSRPPFRSTRCWNHKLRAESGW